MTTNISRETGRLSLLLRSPAKFEPYALRLPSPSSLFSILNEDFIQVSYSDLLSASWQRDAWQYVKSLRRRAYLREKNKKGKEMEFLSSFSSSLLSPKRYLFLFPFRNRCVLPSYSPRQTFRCRTVNARAKLSSAPASLE